MTSKVRVKVIKKSEAKVQPPQSESGKSTRVAAREMVSTVTDWVSEFRTRRSDETRAALEKLFSNRPQPNES
jgi:hypothetical protein